MKTKRFLVMAAVFFLTMTSVYAAPLEQILYTKKTSLTFPKNYVMRFSLCDDPFYPNGDCAYWSEEKTISLTSPKISTYLGDTVSLSGVDFSQQYYLQVERKKRDGTYKIVDTNRDLLGVVPYAMWCAASNTISALPLSLTGSVANDGVIAGTNSNASGYGIYGNASATGDVINFGGFFQAHGNAGIGAEGWSSGTTGYGVVGYASASGAATNYGGYFQANGDSGTGVYSYGVAFDFFADGPGIDYGTASSIRWKKNIEDIDGALEKVMKLRGVYFDWDQEHGGLHDMGFIAEEVGKVVPEIVAYEEDGANAIGLDYGALTPVLVQAMKEQQIIIKVQNEKIRMLEERLERLESSVNMQLP